MESENLDIESITDARRTAIEQTIKQIGMEELKSLGEKIFPSLDHPWRETFFKFLEENARSTFYHATASDQAELLYCPAKEKGIWFLPRGGIGPLEARELKTLKEIACAPFAEVSKTEPKLGAQYGRITELRRAEQAFADAQKLKRTDPNRAVGFYLCGLEAATKELRKNPRDRLALRRSPRPLDASVTRAGTWWRRICSHPASPCEPALETTGIRADSCRRT
jgi:hypothetical protein